MRGGGDYRCYNTDIQIVHVGESPVMWWAGHLTWPNMCNILYQEKCSSSLEYHIVVRVITAWNVIPYQKGGLSECSVGRILTTEWSFSLPLPMTATWVPPKAVSESWIFKSIKAWSTRSCQMKEIIRNSAPVAQTETLSGQSAIQVGFCKKCFGLYHTCFSPYIALSFTQNVLYLKLQYLDWHKLFFSIWVHYGSHTNVSKSE